MITGQPLVVAINSGGPDTRYAGIDYMADKYVSNGNTYTALDDIKNTDDDALFQSERYGSFAYSIPVTNAVYSVRLLFAEVYEEAAGNRTFNVVIEGKTVLTELDIFAAVGHDTPYSLDIAGIAVSDRHLDIAIESVRTNGKISGFAVYSVDGKLDEITPSQPADNNLPVVKSAGCGKPTPNVGSKTNPLSITQYHNYFVRLPANYDSNKAYPVIFGLHHSSSDSANIIDWAARSAGLSQQALDSVILVMPRARQTGGIGWRGWDVPMFEPLYQKITTELCVDINRAFALGYSSGGDYASIIGCEHGDKLTAIVGVGVKPVSGFPLVANERSCKGKVSAIIIHGTRDSAVGPDGGPDTVNLYRAKNHCSASFELIPGYTDSLSNCMRYDDCDPGGQVVFCHHSNPNYSGTYHGYPPFTGKLAWQHFMSF